VKQYEELNRLIRFVEGEGIVLSVGQQEKLKTYLSYLEKFSFSHRIVSRNDTELIVIRHFLSSFYYALQIKKEIQPGDNILDLGSGAGFPGIILSVVFENNRVVLVDSVRKKTLFLKKVAKELDLSCTVHCTRIEEYQKSKTPSFRFVSARALASIEDLVSLAAVFMDKADIHTMKGMDYFKEVKNSEKYDVIKNEIPNHWKDFSGYLTNKVYLKLRTKREK
jgi:16S rRNA (guanine527-N7)-methyltransferase